MPDMALLNSELTDLLAERDVLRTKHRGATMPEEARARDNDIADRVKKVRFLIEEQQQNERDKLFDETNEFLNKPQYQIARGVNDDDDGRRVMMKAGWDIRNGTVYRQIGSGKEIAFCPEDVLFGPLPDDDPVAAKHFHQMRASMQPDYRNSWRKWFRARGDRGGLTGVEVNALSEGISEAGGYLVPADISAEILARRHQTSVMRSISTVRQTSRDRMHFPAVKANASSGSIYSSGFVGGLVGETPSSNTDSGPTFEQYEIGVKKFEAYTKISNDLISDSGSDILAFLASDGGRNLGLVEDNYFLTGNGTGLQPLGLLNGGSTTVDVEGSTANTITNTTSNNGSAAKIIAMAGELPGQYAPNARWLMLRAIKFAILGLVGADGRPWWQQAGVAGGAEGAPATLVEFPVSEHAFMPDDGADTNKVLVLGDFSNFYIVDRTALSVVFDTTNLIGSDQTQIFLRSRAGSGVWNKDAFRIGVV
jgi:HK97 family phage major capsid protein